MVEVCTFELVTRWVLAGYLIHPIFLTFVSLKSLTLQISSTPSNGWCREQVRFLQSCWRTRSWPAASTRWSSPPCSSAASGPYSNAASPSRRSTTTVDLHLGEILMFFFCGNSTSEILVNLRSFQLTILPNNSGDDWLFNYSYQLYFLIVILSRSLYSSTSERCIGLLRITFNDWFSIFILNVYNLLCTAKDLSKYERCGFQS